MKEGYKFVFVTNCSPMGDCKNFDAQFYNALKNKQFFNVKHDGSELRTDVLKKPEKNKPAARVPFDTTKCGMVRTSILITMLVIVRNACDFLRVGLII